MRVYWMKLDHFLTPQHDPVVYVYQDRGVSHGSFYHTVATLQDVGCVVRPLTALELIQGHWQHHAYALVMPGGADIPYHMALKGAGNAVISEYVRSGGRYMGICAGAYYAAEHIVFHHSCGEYMSQERELGFFPGTIHGPFWGPYDPHCPSGATALAISSVHNPHRTWHTYMHGGGQFCLSPRRVSACDQGTQEPPIQPLWIDQRGHWVAVVCGVGLGVALLSACHWEWMPNRPSVFDCGDSENTMVAKDYQQWSSDPESLMSAAKEMVYGGGHLVLP